jgi:hypothetical protein
VQLTARQPLSTTYSVEVSGWDNSPSFFVERTELSWREETGKFLALSRPLCPGTMIFVRLLQPIAAERSSPVAYKAEALAMTTPDGKHRFRIKRCEPRGVGQEGPEL